MHVLLLTEALPPEPIVGAFRPAKVARGFRDAGHTVHIICARRGGVREKHGVFDTGVTYERIQRWPGPRQYYLAAKRLAARAARSVRSDRDGNGAEPRRREDRASISAMGVNRSALRRFLIGLMRLPDDMQGFVPPAVAAALKARAGAPDLIYSTSPAYSIHLAGLLLHRILRRPWVVEVRDPWTTNGVRQLNIRSIAAVDRWLERLCWRNAAAAVVVTEGTARQVAGHLPPGSEVPVICALNGIDELADTRLPADDRSVIRVVYAGAVSPRRDPAPLVAALGRASVALGESGVEIAFVGTDSFDQFPTLRNTAASLPGSCGITAIPWMEQAAARDIMRRADLLLLTAQTCALALPNKLFDYLGTRVPILAIVEPNSDTERLLVEAGGHYVIRTDASADEIDAIVAAALRAAPARAPIGNTALLQQWTTARQMDHLVRSIERRFDQVSRRPAGAARTRRKPAS